MAVLALVALLWAGDRYGADAADHMQVLYWQRQCARHAVPPDAVVWDVPSSTRHSPECWDRFRVLAAGPQGAPRSTVLFLGERQTKSGKTILVAALGDSFPPDVVVVEPATLTRPARFSVPMEVEVGTGWVLAPEGKWPTAPTRWFGGQPHSSDPNRFLMGIERGGKRNVLQASLSDDGDVVYFEILDPGTSS